MNQYFKSIAFGLIFISLFISCKPTLNYLGNTYPPTQKVDIYFDEHDIEKEYRVMGLVKNEGDEFELDDVESIQKAMLEKAKSVGADAILYLGLYHEVERGRMTDTEYDEYGKTERTSSIRSKIYEAKFIKYKK